MNTLVGKRLQLYKLTDKDGYTMRAENPTLWQVGITHKKAAVENPILCCSDVYHAYIHPILAVIYNCRHADFDYSSMRLFEAEGTVVAEDDNWEKVGVFELTIVKEIPLPTGDDVFNFMENVNKCSCSLCTDFWENAKTSTLNLFNSAVMYGYSRMIVNASTIKAVQPVEIINIEAKI